jgi:hypothetical protein
MRKNATRDIEIFRVTTGRMASTAKDGNNGAFLIESGIIHLNVVVSDGADWLASGFPPPVWEHVSVSHRARCPTWDEMDWVKRLFFRDDETVLQFHVPRTEHVNRHNFCLHLWRPVGVIVPRPPLACI